jgi:cell division protein FtsA
MTGLDRNQTPKTRPMPQKRTALVASLDIGTSKIACMIARLKPCPPNEALRGRSHAVELIGYSQIQSRGVKAGAVVDLAECEQAVRHAVALAERMAKVRVESVLLSVSAGRLQGQLIEAAADVTRITSTGMRHATAEGRTVLHALPVGYALDGVKGIRDPRGMVARQFGVDMNVVTSDATVAKNLMLVVERCHLNVEAMAASPYVAGLSVLTDDEADLGAAVVEMGAGTTTIAIYSGGRFVHASGFAVGGQHITMDLARGLSACIAGADRRVRLARTDVGADGRRPRARRAADCVSRHDCKHRPAPRRGDFRDGPGPPGGFSLCGGAEGAGRIERRRFATDRLCRTCKPDSRPTGAYRPPARLRPVAPGGEERVVRGPLGPLGLSAIRSS